MKGPDEYAVDEGLMDELGGAMDDFDSKKFQPVVQLTISISKGDEKPKEPEGDETMPTPEEMDELQKAMS